MFTRITKASTFQNFHRHLGVINNYQICMKTCVYKRLVSRKSINAFPAYRSEQKWYCSYEKTSTQASQVLAVEQKLKYSEESVETVPQDTSAVAKAELQVKEKRALGLQKLAMLGRSSAAIDKAELTLCLRTLDDIYVYLESRKKEEIPSFVKEVKESQEFQVLAELLAKKAPYYSSKEVYGITMSLYKFGYVSTDYPFVVFLQVARYHIKDLELRYLVKLAIIVHDMPQNEQVILLMEGIKALINFRRDELPRVFKNDLVPLADIFIDSLDEVFKSKLLIRMRLDMNKMSIEEKITLLSILHKFPSPNKFRKEIWKTITKLFVLYPFEEIPACRVPMLLEALHNFRKYNLEVYSKVLLKAAKLYHENPEKFTVTNKVDLLLKLGYMSLVENNFMPEVINLVSKQAEEGLQSLEYLSPEDFSKIGTLLAELPLDLEQDVLNTFSLSNYTECLFQKQDLEAEMHIKGDVIRWLWTAKEGSVPEWLEEKLQSYEEKKKSSSRIYVSGFPDATTSQELKEFFESQGYSISKVFMKNGYAFLELTNHNEDIYNLNGENFKGGSLMVSTAYSEHGHSDQFSHIFAETGIDWHREQNTSLQTVLTAEKMIIGQVTHVGKYEKMMCQYMAYTPTLVIGDRTIKTESILTPTKMALGEKSIALKVIKPGNYFHNTYQLKRSHYDDIKTLQKAGYWVLVIFMDQFLALPKEKRTAWIRERIVNINNYQDPETWRKNNDDSLN